MERKAQLAMLVLSLRTNVREVNDVLEALNRGAREQTFPKALIRRFRTMEHDARVVGLARFADVIADAKDAAAHVLEPARTSGLVELFTQAASEFLRAADEVEAGRRHHLDESLVARLRTAAGPGAERAPFDRPTPKRKGGSSAGGA